MIIVRALRANRKWLTLGLFGLLPLFGGCDDGDKNAKPAAPGTTAAQQEAEGKAREAAYGKGGIPPTGPGKGAPAETKPAETKAAPAETKK